MRKLIATRGLPGSGKTTWAKTQLAHDKYQIKRINRDDIRAMLDDGKWTSSNEKFVRKVRNLLVKEALDSGYNVICDDTNLVPKTMEELRTLAKENGAEFVIQDFTDVSLETCIERDLKRLNSVGEAVIRKMYDDFLAPQVELVEYNLALPDCIIVDIDGTVALKGNRNPYDESKVGEDLPNRPICNLIEAIYYDYDERAHGRLNIIFVSGRTDDCYVETDNWLGIQVFASFTLLMRKAGDNRDDRIVKKEIYEQHIKGKYNVLYVIDDRQKVVDMWREQGLTCLQVAKGNF